jgi:hypothetical protein
MAIKISNVTVIDDNRREINTRLTTSVITSNTSAEAGTYYYLNAASIIITLPTSPIAGDQIGIAEISGNVTSVVARNSSNVMGLPEDLALDVAYAAFRLTFVDATQGWVFT